MAIPVMQFPSVKVPDSSNGLMDGLMQGLQIYTGLVNSLTMPQQMKQKQAISDAQLQQTQAQTALTQAQTSKLSQPQSYQPQSSLGKSMADYQDVLSQYGKGSPEAKQFEDMMTAQSQRDQALAASRMAYAQGLPEMLAPKTVRDQKIISLLNQGYSLDDATKLAANQNADSISASGMTPESQLQSQQLSSEVQKTITPVDVQKRQFAGARAEMTLQNMNQFIDQGALNYSGLSGKAKLSKDEVLSSASGKVPTQLSAYRNFQGQLNVLKDEYATTLGVPADQISRGELGSLFDVSQYSTNPDAAKKQLQNVGDLLEKTEDINFTNLHDLSAKNRDIAGKYEKKDSLQINPKKLEQVSQGNSKALGINKIEIPSFNSKSEFQAWYAQQSPAIQAAIKRQLGGQ